MAKSAKSASTTKTDPAALPMYLAEAEREETEALNKVLGKDGGDLFEAAAEMLAAKNEADRLTAEAKQHKDRYDELRQTIIPDLMQKKGLVQSSGKGSFTFSGGKIHLETKLYAACTEANRPTLFSWLRKQKLGDVIKETVAPATLAALVRERREEGRDDPPGVSIHTETVAKLTGTK